MAQAQLSAELLCEIVGLALARYIDELLSGPLKYAQPSASDEVNGPGPSPRDPALADVATNTCMALLESSYQLRHVTLRILSILLRVDLDVTGAGRSVPLSEPIGVR